MLRPKQEQLLRLLSDHGSMSPAEIWAALQVSRQGAMDMPHPLIEAGIVEKIGGKKTGRYTCVNHKQRENPWSGLRFSCILPAAIQSKYLIHKTLAIVRNTVL